MYITLLFVNIKRNLVVNVINFKQNKNLQDLISQFIAFYIWSIN